MEQRNMTYKKTLILYWKKGKAISKAQSSNLPFFQIMNIKLIIKCILPFLLFLFSYCYSYSQVPLTETEKSEKLEQKIEDVVEATDAEVDYSFLIEELEVYLKNKMNLNNATDEDLQHFFFLNDVQINNLIEHIKINGKLISLEELQSIDGFDLETINMLLPYVYVSGDVSDKHIRLKDMLKEGQSQLFIRYQQYTEPQVGFTAIDDSSLAANPNARYLGSPYRLYTRYSFNFSNNINIGFTAEKDPGEEFFKGSQKNGFDFYSAHIYLRNVGKIKALTIGDYHVQFGQGLTFWSGLGFSKSADAVNVKKNPLGIRPCASVDENLFMRGLAGTYAIKNFEISGFYSSKKRDGSVNLSTDTLENNDDQLSVSSLLETGYHRTPSELSKKGTVNEVIYGGNLTYRKRLFSVGVTAARTELSHALDKVIYPYNQFEFSGKENLNLGADYNYIFKNMNIFGEVARSENGGMAYLNGAILSLDPKLSLSALYRKYDINYQSLYSSGFSEGSKVSNEQGLFIGLLAAPVRSWTFTAYADNFSFPWLRYRVNAPSKGFDYMLQVNYKPNKILEMYARYRNKTKQLNNTTAENGLYFLDNTEKENYRYEIKYKVSENFLLKNRLEYVKYSVGDSSHTGFTMYQDFQYAPKKLPFSITLRYALFDTDNYDTRIYVYENDVLYASSFPSYYYKGSRAYILLSYKANRHLDFWFRIAQTYYSNQSTIGTGLDQINGNTKTEVKVQMRVKF